MLGSLVLRSPAYRSAMFSDHDEEVLRGLSNRRGSRVKLWCALVGDQV